mmetsp:Transcript_21492/g.52632  ORF Transcript_21492/g.52632 Transcript_21492/m.52632 type:complete len:211 (-) Transcript_21492:84-716(-)
MTLALDEGLLALDVVDVEVAIAGPGDQLGAIRREPHRPYAAVPLRVHVVQLVEHPFASGVADGHVWRDGRVGEELVVGADGRVSDGPVHLCRHHLLQQLELVGVGAVVEADLGVLARREEQLPVRAKMPAIHAAPGIRTLVQRKRTVRHQRLQNLCLCVSGHVHAAPLEPRMPLHYVPRAAYAQVRHEVERPVVRLRRVLPYAFLARIAA